MKEIYYTNTNYNDGFGSQYQKIIQTYVLCKMCNLKFAYKPIDYVEHNYDNDNDYKNRLENLINLKNYIINTDENMIVKNADYTNMVRHQFDSKIDCYCESEHMKFIKDCFWSNKSRDHFNKNKKNIAIHIRRENPSDKGLAGDRATTPNSYYLNVMNGIRERYNDSNNKELLFHIYSQGELCQFQDLSNNDVIFYLNYDIINTFIGMVSADVLVTSPSSFSYVAALISDGEIHYKTFWHKPRKDWIIHK
jgi:hypothetical protein